MPSNVRLKKNKKEASVTDQDYMYKSFKCSFNKQLTTLENKTAEQPGKQKELTGDGDKNPPKLLNFNVKNIY